MGQDSTGADAGQANWLARGLAGLAVLAAIGVVAWLMFGGSGGGYQVTARFVNASQLVNGNTVRIGGVPVGSVSGLKIAPDGMAEVKLSIDSDHAPLDDGTRAIIRQASLSGIANRYVDLQLPQGDRGGTIPDGGTIPGDRTEAAVDIDQLFRTFGPRTRRSLKGFFKGSAAMFQGSERRANRGLHYLNPALSQSQRLFDKLTADTVLLRKFVDDSAHLVTVAASRREDLAQLVGNLSDTTAAASRDKQALTQVLVNLPDFMRRSNTTFVNLRSSLDQLDPLVADAKPVARKLKRFLPQLRSFANDARPTVRDLSRTVRAPGSSNDLVELLKSFPGLAHIAVDDAQRNGKVRPGAFPQTTDALKKSAPLIGFGRPYTPDLMGWFDDFSHSGSYDALGGFSRTQIYFNLFSVSTGGIPILQDLEARPSDFLATAKTGQVKRCPGGADVAAADGSNVFSAEEQRALDCRESDRAVGK